MLRSQLRKGLPVLLPALLLIVGAGCGGGGSKKPVIIENATSQVPATGGTVEIANVAGVIFPSGAFPAGRDVTVALTRSPEINAEFERTTSVFRPTQRSEYEVRVNVGPNPPLTDNNDAILKIPKELLSQQTSTSGVEVFVHAIETGGLEVLDQFQLVPSDPQILPRSLKLRLPSWAFTTAHTTDGSYEAVMLMAVTPGPNPLSPAPPDNVYLSVNVDACMAANIGKPLSREVEVLAPYGMRPNPGTGRSTMHWGVDLAADGDDVHAVSDGVIEQVNTVPEGYGLHVVLRHSDGSASLYAHLQPGSVGVKVGDEVLKGDRLAASGNSGRSTAPHLHFEYIPNGLVFQSKERINPVPCFSGAVSKGSITVGDNGPDADDAFEVFLNGIKLGQTVIGGSNNLAVNNLRTGRQRLKITAITAPDDAGTYGISLNDGITFDKGETTQEGSISEGQSVEFTIIVPPRRPGQTSIALPPAPLKRNFTPERQRPRY